MISETHDDAGGEAAWLPTPPELAEGYADFDWQLAYQYPQHSVVYRLSRDGETRLYLKLAPVPHYPSLHGEAARMRWAARYLPVPDALEQGTMGSVSWLVTSPLPGRNGTHPEQIGRPEELARILARGLRRFHDAAPVDLCPFDFRLRAALAHVRARRSSGLIGRTEDFHPEFRDLTPERALELLEGTRPAVEDLVVCHGDYCPPNILIQEGRVTGYVDLGELGVADRWWDLAVATWSLDWNLGPGFEELFLEEYGAAPDADRARFYRLLYDLAS